jgi:hypothetical protein
MKIDIHKSVTIEPTIRTELLSSMFEVPASQKLSVSLTGELPLDRDYNIGLIVGPSGSGKTILLESLFGAPQRFDWKAGSVIDDFPPNASMETISRACQSVGFNTIPSWLRPFSVLSNGERFRAETARHLVSGNSTDICTVDEFTSVVDRQVAQFACHSIQKYVRESGRKLVVASCHYDILDWLQPDWILEPGNPCRFTWRSLHGRPQIACQVSRCKYETWELFREFHYMSAELNRAARCYGLYVKSDSTPPRLATEHSHEGLVASADGDFGSRESDSSTRISSGFSMHGHEDDSRMVLHPDDRIESQFSNAEQGSSSTGEYSGSGDSRVSEESVRCSYENESVDKLFAKKVDRVGGQEETTDLSTETICGYESDETGSCRENGETLSTVHRDLGRHIRRTIHSPNPYRIASFCGVLYRPHPRVSDIYGFTRMVTLPDFQGLGLAFALACKVASAYKALGKRLHSYPNHPAWIRSYQRSRDWMQVKQSGTYSPKRGVSSTVEGFGGRRCAVFQYIGNAMNKEEAERLINVD